MNASTRRDAGGTLPDDNAHSPNEKFDLDCFANGMKMAAHLWQELACSGGSQMR